MTRTSIGRRMRMVAETISALALTSSALAAQARTGAVSGVVRDDVGAVIENVEVTAIKAALVVRTDSLGKFMFGSLPAGPLDLSVRRLAFAPVVLMIQVPADDTTEIEVRLTVVAQKLTGVVVQADADHLRKLQGFESRRRLGIGHFITRAQIEKRDPYQLSDMMRMIPGAVLLPGPNGRVVLRFARVGANKECPPQFYIDGIQVTGFSIDEMPVGDVEGVELYAGAAGLPAEFSKLRSTSNCGTVIIWTRVPGN